MKAIAIDDEPLALKVVENFSEKIPCVTLLKSFVNCFEALDYLQKHQVDLLFLDIKMPDITGLDFSKSLRNKPLIIFTTAYEEYAVTGFELDAVDYLLKPFSFVRFLQSCNKARELFDIRNPDKTIEKKLSSEKSIYLKDSYEIHKVNIDEIIYIEAFGNYVKFHFLKRKFILSRMTFSEAMNKLKNHNFFQVHRSFSIQKKAIIKVDKDYVYIEDAEIPISSSFRDNIKQNLGFKN